MKLKMIDKITPILLTYNEQENIDRTLSKLAWARDIVVVDSFSTDNTLEILNKYDQVRVYTRTFDSHEKQWNYALKETEIATEWVLALDADYLLSDAFIDELKLLTAKQGVAGYRVGFRYCVWGKPLRGTLYPPVTALYQRKSARYIQDGHTQRVVVDGVIESIKSKILHDDRKPLSRWIQSQDKYARLEAQVMKQADWSELGVADKLRKFVVLAPLMTFLYCYFLKGGLLDGMPGLFYAWQRTLAEIMLSLRLIEQRTNDKGIGTSTEQSK